MVQHVYNIVPQTSQYKEWTGLGANSVIKYKKRCKKKYMENLRKQILVLVLLSAIVE